MISKTLRSESSEIGQFIETFNALSQHSEVDFRNIDGKKVRVFYKNSRMVGGYVVNTVPPFQYLAVSNKAAWQKLADEDDFAEIVHIWLDRSSGEVSQWDRAIFWFEVISDYIKTGKKYYLGGALCKKVRDYQKLVLRNDLDTGIVLIKGQQRKFWTFYGSLWDMLIHFPIAVLSVLLKDARKNLSKKKHMFSKEWGTSK